jgi:hypothetical protein
VAFKSTDFKGHFPIFEKTFIMKKITSLEQLKQEAMYDDERDTAEFFMLLAGGICRSSKRITYFPDTNTFDIHNEIDDSFEEDLTEEQLRNKTHIVLAIENGAFFKYEY